MTVLRSREVLPRHPLPPKPAKGTPGRKPRSLPESTAIGPRTPARAEASRAAAGSPGPGAGPELDFGAGSSTPSAVPRRSCRLASRSVKTPPAECEVTASGLGRGEEMREPERRQRGKRNRDADGAAGEGGSRHVPEGKRRDGGGFDLNLPLHVEHSQSDGKGKGKGKMKERGKTVDLTVSSSSSYEEAGAARGRDEVIEVESDRLEEDADVVARHGGMYTNNEKGKGIMIEDEAPARDFRRTDWPVSGSEADDEGEGIIHEENRTDKSKWLTLADLGVAWVRRTHESRVQDDPSRRRKESDKMKARELAPKFALFKPDEDGDSEGRNSADSSKDDPTDWPGPFSTALKIIADREKQRESRWLNRASSVPKLTEFSINWVPSGDSRIGRLKRQTPSLFDLSLRVLLENATDIESLKGIPDEIRHQLSWYVCKSRKMDDRILELFVKDSPTEIRVPDCSWATEEQFKRIFGTANTNSLAVRF